MKRRGPKISSLHHPNSLIFGESKEEALIYYFTKRDLHFPLIHLRPPLCSSVFFGNPSSRFGSYKLVFDCLDSLLVFGSLQLSCGCVPQTCCKGAGFHLKGCRYSGRWIKPVGVRFIGEQGRPLVALVV